VLLLSAAFVLRIIYCERCAIENATRAVRQPWLAVGCFAPPKTEADYSIYSIYMCAEILMGAEKVRALYTRRKDQLQAARSEETLCAEHIYYLLALFQKASAQRIYVGESVLADRSCTCVPNSMSDSHNFKNI
jgi:hypothetical protein